MDTIKIIQQRIKELEGIEIDLKTTKEILDDVLISDERIIAIDCQMKELRKNKTNIIDEILSSDRFSGLLDKLKEIKQSKKDLDEMLSAELVQYNRETKKGDIELPNGEIRRIIIKGKVKKTNQPSMF